MRVCVSRESTVQNFRGLSRSDEKPVKVISVTKPPDCSLLTTFPPGFASHHAFQVSREQNTGTFPSPNLCGDALQPAREWLTRQRTGSERQRLGDIIPTRRKRGALSGSDHRFLSWAPKRVFLFLALYVG